MQKTMPLILGLLGTVLLSAEVVAQPAAAITAQTEYARFGIRADGKGVELVELRSGTNYCRQGVAGPVARVEIEGKSHGATKAVAKGDVVALEFGDSGVTVELRITAKARYFVVEVVSASTEKIEELVFLDLPLSLSGAPGESFAACALALNLKTRVRAIPQATSQLWAASYPRFGLVGAKVAIIGCPYEQLRSVMQEVVSDADDLPHSAIGVFR